MIVNKATLSAIFVALKATFNKGFDAAPSQWQKIAMLVPSNAALNDYKWLENFPAMKKWIGEKVIKALVGHGYTITNDDFEATVAVRRNDIDDDNIGIYTPQAEMAGFSAKQLPDEIVFALVRGGFTSKCYDGQNFFSATHKVKGANVSNLGTKKLSVASQAAAKASYGAARTAMRKFKDEEGRPLNITPNILLVSPTDEDTATALMTVDRLEDGKPNPYKGTATVIVDARLDDNTWFLLDTTKPVRPFIYQERKKPVFVSQTNPEAEDVFMKGEYKFGAEARAAGGYAFWQMAFGSTGVDD